MKYVSIFFALLVCTAALADPNYPNYPGRPHPRPQPMPQPYPVPAPLPMPYPGNEAKGRVHRLSMQIERESVEAVTMAKSLFSRGLYDRLTDDEVRAVAELAFVQDVARNFRNAVATENYYDNSTLSKEAYMWLHRAFTVVERDPVIAAQYELKQGRGPVAQMERSMYRLRQFYTQAERLGWGMAEVVAIAVELERDTAKLYQLAARETDNRREQHILQMLEGFRQEAQAFNREASMIRVPGSARVVLADNYNRLQSRFSQLDRVMENPRFVRFSQPVRAAFDEVRAGYRDLQLAFGGVRTP